ncbi:MAG TPA: LamG-like jellyroll fold domain-containing protein, partial [Chitinivibrionales bacterium]
GDNALLRIDDSYGIGTCGWYHNSVTVDTSFAITKSGRFLANTGWHFIAYSIDTLKNVQTLSIDAVQCATTIDANPINYKGLGKDTYIGIHGNGKTYFNFIGRIDEVRVSSVPLNPDWIKLCFMNQKEQDALVKW